MKKSVYFNSEWSEALNCLKEDIRDKVISAIILYQTNGKMPSLTEGKAVFMLLKLEVDSNNRRLQKAREKRAQKKGQASPAPEPDSDSVSEPSDAPAPERSSAPETPDAPKPEPTQSQEPAKAPEKPQPTAAPKPRPEISPEKKAAIASLLASLMQPRPNNPTPKNGR